MKYISITLTGIAILFAVSGSHTSSATQLNDLRIASYTGILAAIIATFRSWRR